MSETELFLKIVALREHEKAEGHEMFLGIPDRWMEAPLWRCSNEHVSSMYLKSESAKRDLCLECGEPVFMTFPEDKDGPLP